MKSKREIMACTNTPKEKWEKKKCDFECAVSLSNGIGGHNCGQ